MESDINERVLALMEYYGVNKTVFANSIGINPSVLSHIASKRNKPSIDMVINIANNYPKVSLDWLLIGRGAMIKDEIESSLKKTVQKSLHEMEMLHELNHQAMLSKLKTIKEELQS